MLNIKDNNKSIKAKIYSHGKINIPVSVKNDLAVHDGDELIFIKKDTSWLITTRNNILKESQAYFSKFVPKGVSVVDELLSNRRKEAEEFT
ncbi:MAG: hypothetical protein QG673_926 [Pseudomonadota bacterium]|nr:hypothetical protein [Pseudomonadota bacterium]